MSVESPIMGAESRCPVYLALFAPGPGSRQGNSKDWFPDCRPEIVKDNGVPRPKKERPIVLDRTLETPSL